MPDCFVDLTVTSPPYDGLRTYNGSGIAEGRYLKDKSFNLAQMPNRITNDCLTENALLLQIPC